MPDYYVEAEIEFSLVVPANSPAEAKQKTYDHIGDKIPLSGDYDVNVTVVGIELERGQ